MKRLIPTLYTQALEVSIDFYCKILGFQCDSYEEEYGWAKVSNNGVEIMFSLPNQHLIFKKPLFTGSLYIIMTEVELYYNSIKDKVEIAYPLESFEYGIKEFAIYDNNGYMIQFGEEQEEVLSC